MTDGSRGSWDNRKVFAFLGLALLIGLLSAYYSAPYVGVASALLLGFSTGMNTDCDADKEEVRDALDSQTPAGDGGDA